MKNTWRITAFKLGCVKEKSYQEGKEEMKNTWRIIALVEADERPHADQIEYSIADILVRGEVLSVTVQQAIGEKGTRNEKD